MSGISIDPGKCIGCGACVKDCLPQNLRLEAGKAVPLGPCFLCGHCVALCPTGAVTVTDPAYAMAEVVEVPTAQARLDGDAFLTAVKCRRSIRQFQRRDIPQDLLAQVLEAGRFTETGGNRQDVGYVVLQKELDAFKPLVWDAWRDFVASGGMSNYKGSGVAEHLYDRWQADPEDDGLFFHAPVLLLAAGGDLTSVGMALSNIEHMANANGLGMIVMGYLRRAIQFRPALLEPFHLEGREALTCALLGYPAVSYRRSVPRKPADIQWH